MRKLLAWCIVGCTLFSLTPAMRADSDENQIDKDEVIRRGNMVQELGTGIRGENDDVGDAMNPPADDSGKWYISLITTQGCSACELLKKHFLNSTTLQAWVKPEDPDHSWAHYQVYRWEDQTQKSRWDNIKVRGFPTLLVQPPRSGKYGKSSTVVLQRTGYDGNAEKLSKDMSEAIQKYVKAYRRKHRLHHDDPADGFEATNGALFEPPFNVPPPPPSRSGHRRSTGQFNVKDDLRPLPAGTRGQGGGGIGQQGGGIGVDPPFDLGPGPNKDPNYPNEPVVEVPPVRPASIEQLKQYIPGADDKFIMAQLEQRATLEQAMAAWRTLQQQGSPLAPSGVGGVLAYAAIAFGSLLCFVFFIVFLVVAAAFARRALRKIEGPAGASQAVAAGAVPQPPAAAAPELSKAQYDALLAKVAADLKP